MELRTLRKNSGYTLKTVADSVGITVQALSRYEREEREADYFMLQKLAEFYGVSVDYIIGNKEKTAAPPRSKSVSQVIARLENLPEDKLQKIAPAIENFIDILEKQ